MKIIYQNRSYKAMAKKITKSGVIYLILIEGVKKWVKGKEDIVSGYSNFLAR
jgi:hypothetical protein